MKETLFDIFSVACINMTLKHLAFEFYEWAEIFYEFQ